MRTRLTKGRTAAGLGTLLALALAASPASGLVTANSPDQRSGSHDSGGRDRGSQDITNVGGEGTQHYSELTQIDKRNLSRLAPTWRTHLSAVAPATDDTGQQTTPIVVDGVIYTDTPGGEVAAVDGKTGEALWKWAPEGYPTTGTRRGVSSGEGRIYTLAGDNRVVALDQATGEEVWVVQPAGPEGEDLGRVGKVATIYSEGIVYAHAADGDRGAVVALDASDGSYLWHFFGGPQRGEEFTGVDGVTFDASETWGPVLPDGTDCAEEGGATPWMQGTVDPELGMYYMTFGNARSCTSSQNGSLRPGDNLFSTTMVAVDAETGDYKWHYQSIHHDVWDMDNVHPPSIADVRIRGQKRQVIFYGSKSGHQFVLDRTNGEPVVPVTEKPMITDSRQNHSPTQPFPQERLLPECLTWQKLDPKNVPGDPWRAVPNYNGYQPDERGNLVFNPDSYVAQDEPFLTYPDGYPSDHRRGCMYDPQWDAPILSTTSQNGGGDWSNQSYSERTNLVYFTYGTNPVAHWNGAGANGQRAIGQYQTGGILAYDAATGKVRWRNHLGTDMSHGQGPMTTASDLVFVGQIDGRLLAMDARSGKVLWEFQTGSGISGAPITYKIDGEQYVAVLAAGSTNPYGGSVTQGDSLWAFKLGGRYTTESGSQEGPMTAPLDIRRPVQGGPVEGDTVDNTVLLARTDRTDSAAAQDSTSQRAMAPTHLRVPVGSTVSFLNPGAETFPTFPNQLEHCATQYFEGEFNARLQPGESYEHTFDRAGEYFFNDCTDPRPVGKIEVYLEPEERAGALRFLPGTIDLRSWNGRFTGVRGRVVATFDVPRNYRYDGDAALTTPLSESPVTPTKAWQVLGKLIVWFDKAELDNNVPEGSDVELSLSANFLTRGEQVQLTSTDTVRIVK